MTADELNGTAFPELACLIDLIAAHPTVASDGTLGASVSVLKARLIAAWEASESLADA